MTDTSKEVPGADELCNHCGHLFNPHRLCGYGDPPTEGWMECPVESCDCRMTWSMAPEVAEQVRANSRLKSNRAVRDDSTPSAKQSFRDWLAAKFKL